MDEYVYFIRINTVAVWTSARHFDNTGPYTLEQLKALNIQPQDFIWQVGTKDWVQAKEIEDLNKFIASNAT